MAAVPESTQRVGVVVVLALSLAAILWLERDRDWGRHLRARLVMGVPWGTLLVSLGVLSVFLFLQDGWNHWRNPVTIPYHAWSYFSPFGVLVAAFSHAGSSHLVGNLTATLVVMPLAEYVFGHFPTERGTTSFGSLRTNPLVRALVLFPAGVVVVGLMTALWSWGPVIGFSGVVFAAVGFALVRYPLAAVVALSAQGVVVTLYRALLNPVLTREASRRFVRPGWAGIAVQGHALGLFLGATAAVLLLRRRGRLDAAGPGPLRLWLGAVLVASGLGLWQLWWVQGGSTYVLYRAAGFGFLLVVGLLVTWAAVASDRPMLGGGDFGLPGSVTRRQTAFALLLVPTLVMAGVAVPLNRNTVGGETPADAATVEVREYTVLYAEDVPDRMINVVDVELFGETTRVNTSGLIVVNRGRNVWSREVPPGQLAANGRASVVVGGPGWRETVVAVRRGWSAVGGGTAYKVWIGPREGPYDLAFRSDPATADAVIDGYEVSVAAEPEGFALRLSRNGSVVAQAPVPDDNESVRLASITFSRDGRTVVAAHENTTVSVAKRETY
ncbi:MAG: rhomboid family intramembrane serine protease [Halobacteriales archaeon]